MAAFATFRLYDNTNEITAIMASSNRGPDTVAVVVMHIYRSKPETMAIMASSKTIVLMHVK